MVDELTVRVGDAEFRVGPDDTFTFGRAPSCSVCLDASDIAISRQAGRFEHDGRGWWVVNSSASRQFAVVDEIGLRSVLPPARRATLDGVARVLVDGSDRVHELAVDVPRASEIAVESAPTGLSTSIGDGVLVNDADRAALVALFAGYLEQGRRYDPYPKSYAAAAARLGWPRTTLVKRVEYLRSRLSAAGVPNLSGWNALANLAEYALTTGLITRDDLAMLNR